MRTSEPPLAPFPRRALITLFGIWLAWAAALMVFQELVPGRIALDRPDTVLDWTGAETGLRSDRDQPNLLDPTLAGHVAWDSAFYVSIAATGGYDDPNVPTVDPGDGSGPISLNYAFMPLYPAFMWLVAQPLLVLGFAPIAASVVAGLAISLGSALAAMVAMYAVARRRLGDAGGIRAATFLIVFPSGFFLAQVYPEALFLALALGSLAMLAERRVVLAGVLAVLAVWASPVGVALVIPLAIGAFQLRRDPATGLARTARQLAGWAVAVVAPLLAFTAWAVSPLGARFGIVQGEYFGQQLLGIVPAWEAWTGILGGLGGAPSAIQIHYGLEIAAIGFALVASIWAIRWAPGVALFGLVAMAVPLTSGAPQSLIRYALTVPAIFLLLARLGAHPAFDRGWLIASTLLMGFLTLLFTFDFWVA